MSFEFSIIDEDIKTKKRERLTNMEEDVRVAISYIKPDIENICKSHQAQISYTKYSISNCKIVIIFKYMVKF